MTSSALRTWIDGEGDALLWVEFEDYARRVFANSPDDWYGDPTRYASTLIQAQGVIPTGVTSIDVLAAFVAARDAGAAAPEAAEVVEFLGGLDDASFMRQALDALLHRFAGNLDVLVRLRAPADLLAPEGGPNAAGFDELDDVAAAMAGFLRAIADKPIAGLVIEKAGASGLSEDETDAYEPLVSAARHYGWITAMSLPECVGAPPDVPLDLDVLVLPSAPVGVLDADARGPRIGGGLDDSFWAGGPLPGGAGGGRLLHGCIPASANPETVLAALGSLDG